jgi:dTDP-4-amino-4,6-dideoxygalactose transaminase
VLYSSQALRYRCRRMSWRVPLSALEVDEELLGEAREALASGWWSSGPRVAAFETAFAEFVDAPHAVACSNGTAALHLALLACGVGPGDEVVMPSLTFVAAANATRLVGAEPVFCDIVGPADLNVDPESLERAITQRTKAVIVVHNAGFACDMDAIRQTAERAGVPVIEDAAHAPGASWRGTPCGTLGELGCFSFFANKNLPIGEGGMIVTRDEGAAARLRLLRSHGMSRMTWDRHRGHAATYDVTSPGLNYRLDEVRAALGIVQLKRLPAENAARERIVERYRRALAEDAGVEFPFALDDPRRRSSHHLAVVLVAPEERDRIRGRLGDAGIQTSVHYPPIHTFSAYRERAVSLPRTDAVAGRLLTLPLYGHMTAEQADAVIDGLRGALPLATPNRKS